MQTELIPVVHVAGPYSSHRLFEWTMTVCMLGVSFVLALPGDSLDRTALQPLVDLGFSEANLAAFFGVVGALRLYALAANGYLNNGMVRPSGALIRSWGAIAGAVIWAQLALSLIIDSLTASSVSMFLPVLIGLSISEILSCVRARRDAVERRRPRTAIERAVEGLTGG